MTNTLHETEYDTWLLEQVEILRQGKLEALDIPNLIEELEALVRGEKSAVESLAYQILLHLLLIEFWHEESEYNRRHWRSEIVGFQIQLSNKLTTNLKNYLNNRFDYLYTKALKAAVLKTGLTDRFPEQNPYGLSQTIDLD